MIVEALLDLGDGETGEGTAPKDVFTWMASKYPLQTNFRPSASQALQKAYKRGRLEKLPGGKYRLNATWEGGATSKRTTRRPQTLAQTTYAIHHSSQASSPFTHAPLQPPQGQQSQPPQQQPNGYPFPYPYAHYPGYPPPAGNRSDQKTTATAQVAKLGDGKATDSAENNDAWEAAQHIFQAINFGDLATRAAPEDAAEDLTAVLTALANAAAAAEQQQQQSRSTLSDDERAALQAQLALLAAQLTEIADSEEEDPPPPPPTVTQAPSDPHVSPAQPLAARPELETAVTSVPPPASGPTPASTAPAPTDSEMEQAAPSSAPRAPPPKPVPQAHPPPIAAYPGTHIMLDINAFPEIFPPSAPLHGTPNGAQAEAEADGEGESDEDEDMEDVVVPPLAADALRT
ncbi:uncharacterized protein BXZ73DRAFT_90081 [Epithele typhae]|uniref:uncharacterized protein n=1 Tax=Epithele typhae TaxID=378194 RepID=UPI0020072843|nr:uncharacterized protein BXZ73DRAFT_90081 [Epithele typhae]KAH9931647.1 hypothetical protein BXZ73DRAFT_90081 [Epithele typhae]